MVPVLQTCSGFWPQCCLILSALSPKCLPVLITVEQNPSECYFWIIHAGYTEVIQEPKEIWHMSGDSLTQHNYIRPLLPTLVTEDFPATEEWVETLHFTNWCIMVTGAVFYATWSKYNSEVSWVNLSYFWEITQVVLKITMVTGVLQDSKERCIGLSFNKAVFKSPCCKTPY